MNKDVPLETVFRCLLNDFKKLRVENQTLKIQLASRIYSENCLKEQVSKLQKELHTYKTLSEAKAKRVRECEDTINSMWSTLTRVKDIMTSDKLQKTLKKAKE